MNSEREPYSKKQMFRANIVAVILLALFFTLILRLYDIQYFEHDKYAAIALSQQRCTENISPLPGSFLFSNGEILAASFQVKSYYADPTFMQDRMVDGAKIADAAGMPDAERAEFLKRLNREGAQFVWIGRKVPPETAKKLDALKETVRGIYSAEEYRRYYPKGQLASHVIGFCNVDGNPLEGVEATLADCTAGAPGKREFIRDALGNRIYAQDGENYPARSGNSIVLTIDPRVQLFAETALDEVTAEYNPESATAIVIESRTGAILALANRPAYDPNKPGDAKPENRKNHAAASIFEPGSIFKPFTVAAAIEKGAVTPQTRFDCHHGAWKVAGRTIHDSHKPGYGVLTVKEIIAVSSNIGAAQVGLAMGPELQRRFIKQFGFGKPTGSGLQGELPGMLTPDKRWKNSTTVSVSFGQEIAVTPIQMAYAFNVFAANGLLLKPQIINRIISPDGKAVFKMKPEIVRRVISPDTVEKLTDMMIAVVESGTAKSAKLKGYLLAGKTGTAQIARTDAPGYDDRFVSSFVCYAPAKQPLITVLISVRDPKGVHYGGVVAAPAVREIIRKYFAYKNIPSAEKETVAEKKGKNQ
jgi:cell division protein FtsI/penicillin-binding protein 2